MRERLIAKLAILAGIIPSILAAEIVFLSVLHTWDRICCIIPKRITAALRRTEPGFRVIARTVPFRYTSGSIPVSVIERLH